MANITTHMLLGGDVIKVKVGWDAVTSRSGALRPLILWGHLLASDLDPFWCWTLYIWLWCDWQMIWCVTIHVYGCYWLSWLSVQVCDLEDAEASVDPLGLRTESGSVLLGWFVYYDVDLMWWFDDDILTWLLVMQADDSLPTWLTYGVKGPHTIAERLRERGGQQPCHRLLALPPWLEL